MLMSQLLSLKVESAPVPGALWVKASIWVKSSGEVSVTVKDSHDDSGMRVQKLSGWPKSGESAEIAFHSSHAPSSLTAGLVGIEGAVVFVPRQELDVMDPRVMKTTSAS